jgi:HTH-type transcriptional regulator / antitoxin MqsA
MKCPNCASAELVCETRDMPYTYKGEATVIAGVTGDWCPACGEGLFGGGANAFSRYETGKTIPPVALVKLFKVLDRHPDLLAEVRAG